MRRFLSLALVVTVALAAPALAGPPAPGTYQSQDLGGPVLTGNYTETWPSTGDDLSAGIVLAVDSWDGHHRATQWMIRCAQTVTPAEEVDRFTYAPGWVTFTYVRTFTGGSMWLSGSGPWGGGNVADYWATIDSYVNYVTFDTINGHRMGTWADSVRVAAHFDDYPGLCLTITIHNVRSGYWMPSKPGRYPSFLSPVCISLPSPHNGVWGTLTEITFTIYQCTSSATPVEPITWGALKARYE